MWRLFRRVAHLSDGQFQLLGQRGGIAYLYPADSPLGIEQKEGGAAGHTVGGSGVCRVLQYDGSGRIGGRLGLPLFIEKYGGKPLL